jgi:hypothetical protein
MPSMASESTKQAEHEVDVRGATRKKQVLELDR